MNRHSLIFNITLFFVFLMMVINTLFFIQYRFESQEAVDDLMKRFHESERVLHMAHMDGLPFDETKKRLYDIMKVELVDVDEKIINANIILQDRERMLYEKDQEAHYILDDPRRGVKIHLKYANYDISHKNLIVFALLINFSVLMFYLYVRRRLKPLNTLKKNIVHFAEDGTSVITDLEGKDEISEVSNEFSHMTKKIQTLEDSRKLFLRNIMHELKTPITKGKLITDLMEDRKNQERLKRIFSRFEYLLGEFTKIERVTSNVMTLNKKKYRVIDILDNAFDLLLIDEASDIDLEVNASLEIEADYELISIALKNLIDNAMKYGKDRAKIIVAEESIVIQSSGDELKKLSFDKVFNRKYEGSEKGLGLGLYITQNIVSKHGYSFTYEYHEGINNFMIHF